MGNSGPIGAWLCPLATLDILPLTRSIFWPGYYRSRLAPRQALLIHLAFNMDMQTFCSKSGNLFQCRTPLPKNLHHNHNHKICRGDIYPLQCSQQPGGRESRSAGGCVPSWHVTPRGHSVGGDWCSSQMVTLATLGTWSIDPTYSDTHMKVQE